MASKFPAKGFHSDASRLERLIKQLQARIAEAKLAGETTKMDSLGRLLVQANKELRTLDK